MIHDEIHPRVFHDEFFAYKKPDGTPDYDHPNFTMFYDRQWEILESIYYNDTTVVVAANMLGKDFVAGFACLWYFLHWKETRIVTTSVKASHLDVLWGEINRWVNRCKTPLRVEDGGSLYCTSQMIRKVVKGVMCPRSYIQGMVSAKPEGLQGHHAERTLFVVDEASGSDDVVFDMGDTWARKSLIFGNPIRTTGRFHSMCKAGDLAY